MEANKIAITDEALRKGAESGMDGFIKVFTDRYLEVTGGVVNATTMPLLNGYQHSLLGYHFFREEVDEGGFVQLIQNGTALIFSTILSQRPCACLGQRSSRNWYMPPRRYMTPIVPIWKRNATMIRSWRCMSSMRPLRAGGAVYGYGGACHCPNS